MVTVEIQIGRKRKKKVRNEGIEKGKKNIKKLKFTLTCPYMRVKSILGINERQYPSS